MNALKLFGPNDIRIVKQDAPSPGAGEVILKIMAASICGTDVRMLKNGAKHASPAHPLTLGHEMAGVVHAVGHNVTRYHTGQRVAVQPNFGCGVCACCQKGYNHLCADYEAFGVTFDGAFAEYVRVPSNSVSAGDLVELPEGVSFEEGAIAEPLSCIYNGFMKLSAECGETALVIGAGPIGIGHAMFLSLNGLSVIMTDIAEERLRAAKALVPGIRCCISAELEQTVADATNGRGLDVAVVACPSPQAQAQVMGLMGVHGRINFFGGVPADKQPVAIDTNLIHYRELVLTGSTRSSLGQFASVLNLIEQGRIEAKGLITNIHPFKDIIGAFEQAAHAVGLKHVIRFE